MNVDVMVVNSMCWFPIHAGWLPVEIMHRPGWRRQQLLDNTKKCL